MLPHMANLHAKGKNETIKRYLYKSFEFVSMIALPLGFGIAGIATTLAPIYFGQDFSISGKLLIIEAPVILLIGWSNVIGQQYMMPTEQISKYTKSVIIGAIVNVILNVPLIMYLGAVGAPIATVAAELSVTLYQLFVVRKQIQINLLFSDFWKYLFSSTVMFIVVYGLNVSMPMSIINLIVQIVEGMIIYLGMLLVLQPKLVVEGKSLLLGKLHK